jgi:hypothetical protein
MSFELSYRDTNELYYHANGEEKLVSLKQCFPRTMPDKYLSVMDNEGKEIALIDNIDDLDEHNRKVVSLYLRFKNFNFTVTKIVNIEEEYGVRNWEVETEQGSRRFQTDLQEWPKVNYSNEMSVEDINGDKYLANMTKLDDKSLKILDVYLD